MQKAKPMNAKTMNKEFTFCNCGGKFPTFAVIVLVIGIIWLLNDLNVFTIDIPWFPVVIILIAIGWIINSYSRSWR